MRLSIRTGNRARLAAIVTLAIVSACAALAWPDTRQTSASEASDLSLVQPRDKPSGPVEITSVRGQTTWSDEGSAVTVEVINRSDRRVVAEVWYVLADIATVRPWESPTGEGKPTRVVLMAQQRSKVQIPVKRAPKPGAWTLSLWAHVVDGQRTIHSHGVAATPLVHVLPTNPEVFRRSEPGKYAALTVVEPVGRLVSGTDMDGPDALVSVQPVTQQPVHVELNCYLSKPGTAEPWRHADAIASPVVQVPLTDGTPAVASCAFPSTPTEGTWQLSAFIRRGGEGVSSHEDGLYSSRYLRFGR